MRKLNKLFTIAGILILLLSIAFHAMAAVPEDAVDSPYGEAIEKMMELGVFHGFPDGTFRPDETMTRAQAATVITYLLGKSNEAKDNISATGTKFPDVPAGHWASPYINICVDEGIYAGFPDGTFRPEEPVTQRQLAVLLLKVLGYSPAWEEVDEKAAELGLLSWDYNGNLAAPRGILAQAVYNATFQVSRADGTYIADEIFVDETGSGQEPTPANGDGSSSNPSTPSPGNGNVADDPEPKTESITISVIVTELMDYKTYSITVHSINIEGGERWTLGSPDNEKKEVGEQFTRGSKDANIDLFIFDARGEVIKTFDIDFRDYHNEVLE
jgi:hypothetical protein